MNEEKVNTLGKRPSRISLNIGGRQVTCTFSEEPNPNLSTLIRNTLLDSYLRNTRIGASDTPPTDAYSILSGCAACQ